MTLWEEFQQVEGDCFTLADTVFDVCTDFEWCKEYYNEKEPWDRFCKAFFSVVEIDRKISATHIILKITELIQENKEEFTAFMKEHWGYTEYEGDDFDYEWVRELILFLEGNATDGQYKMLTEVLEKIAEKRRVK